MKILIATLFLVLSIILQTAFVICLIKANNKAGKQCTLILLLVALISIFDVASLYSAKKSNFFIFTVLWHMLLPILLYVFLRYIRFYVKQKNAKIYDIIMLLAIGADVGLLIYYVFNPQLFQVLEVEFDGKIFYRVQEFRGLWYHDTICMLLGCFSLYLTVTQAFKAPKLFKVKYTTLAIAEFCVLIWNIVFMFFRKLPVDLSVLAYIIIAFEFAYFTLINAPKKLEHNIQSLLLNTIDDGFIVFDLNKEMFYSNKAIHKMFTEDEINLSYEEFIGVTIQSPISEKYVRYQKIINDSCHYYLAYHNKFVDNKGKIEAYYVIFYDTTTETQAQIEKEYNESRDPLTGTFNRTEFINAVERMKRDLPNEDYYVVATNFEKFRLYNEVNGTDAGDDILIKMSKILYDIAKKYRIAFSRMGSDNFGICITKKTFNEIHFQDLLVNKFRQYEGSYLKLKMGVCSLNNRDIYDAFGKAIQTMHYYKNNNEVRCGFYV